MRLRSGGIDIFYIDESHDKRVYVVTAIAIPFLRQIDGIWRIVWPDHLDEAKAWRRRIKANFNIPTEKELHGYKLAAGEGHYNRGKWNFPKSQSRKVYEGVLRDITFIPGSSIISIAATRGPTGSSALFGSTKLDAAMHALFQRMRSQCAAKNVNAMTFFDEGHPEYRTLYRRAQVYLPTGSAFGGWMGGRFSRNIPLDMFFKDANEKNSKHCYFTQTADLIAYSAFLKRRSELGQLTAWQNTCNYGTLYNAIPNNTLNIMASRQAPRDAIVRL